MIRFLTNSQFNMTPYPLRKLTWKKVKNQINSKMSNLGRFELLKSKTAKFFHLLQNLLNSLTYQEIKVRVTILKVELLTSNNKARNY